MQKSRQGGVSVHSSRGISTFAATLVIVAAVAVAGIYITVFRESPARFELSNLMVAPSEVEYGESANVSVDVSNVGDESGIYELVLKIDGEVEDSEEISVSGDETQTHGFTVTFDELGEVEISIGNLSKKIEVVVPTVTYDLGDAPRVPSYSPLGYEEKPDSGAWYGPGYEFSLSGTLHHMYVESGLARVSVKNEGSNSIFVYQVGVDGDWVEPEGYWYPKEVGFTVEPGEEQDLGLVSFVGPETPGEHEVELGISLLAETEEGNWYDYGTQRVDPARYYFEGRAEYHEDEYSQGHEYFVRINNLVDPKAPGVRERAIQIASEYSGEYNVYQLCALFDWIRDEIGYVSDPQGEDYWSPPDETLNAKGGDCEDHAILLASMIEAIGGQSRIILTESHALASVYIGDNYHADEVMNGISCYYGENLPYAYWTEENQRWLVLESSGGLYPGDLPVGAELTEEAWTFTETEEVQFIDII